MYIHINVESPAVSGLHLPKPYMILDSGLHLLLLQVSLPDLGRITHLMGT